MNIHRNLLRTLPVTALAGLLPLSAQASPRAPDYIGIVDSYVDADRRDADYGVGVSAIGGWRLNEQISAEVRAFGAGLHRQRPGTPMLVGAGADLKADGRHGLFLLGGGGAEYGSYGDSHRASPYVEVGGGWQYRLLPDLSLRVEARYQLQYLSGFAGELWAGAGVALDLAAPRPSVTSPTPDVQVVAVRCPAAPEGLSVDGDGVLVTQDSRAVPIGFATDSAVLDDAAQAVVQQLAQALLCGTAQQLAVQIVGHADRRGDAVYNVVLAERRAQSVRDALVADGVREDRIDVDSEGKYEPLEKRRSAPAYAANRRIEIKLYPGVVAQ